MYDELKDAIRNNAYQVCLYKDKIAIWVRGEDARNKILLNARGLEPHVSRMRGGIYIIKLKLDNAIKAILG